MAQPDTDERLIEEIQDKLVTVGVPQHVFDPAIYRYIFYTDASFAKLLRPLKCINGNLNVEKVLQIGVTHRFFSTIPTMLPTQFYRFLEFLRTPAGQTSISKAAKLCQMEKRGGDTLSAAEVGWLDMFDAQKSDYNSKVGMIRRQYELLIADLKRQLRETRIAMTESLEAVKTEFNPAGSYEGIPNEDLNGLCWKAYRAEHGKLQMPTEHSLKQAVNVYGQNVRRRHKVEHLETGNCKQQLRTFVENKVVRLVEAGDERAAQRFQDLLALVQQTTKPTLNQGVEQLALKPHHVMLHQN